MKWTVGVKIATGFGIALAIFVVVGVVSYFNTSKLIKAAQWQRHTYEVLAQRDEVNSAFKDIGLALRTYFVNGEERDAQRFQNLLATLHKAFPEWRNLVADNPTQVARVDRIKQLFEEQYQPLTSRMIEVRRTKGVTEAGAMLATGQTEQTFSAIRTLMTEFTQSENALLEQRSAAANSDAETAKSTILYGTTIALLLAMLAGYLITRDISTPLQHLTAAATRITQGDLASPNDVGARTDEIGALHQAMQRMTKALRSMATQAEMISTGDLRGTVQPQSDADVLGNAFANMSDDLRDQTKALIEGASVLSSSASEIVASTNQLAASATEAAAAVSETTATAEEVRQTAQLTSQKSKAVADMAQRVVQISHAGLKSTQEVESGTARIRQQMAMVTTSMGRLLEQSRAVGQIITTVEDLATQSNLLAVNAAIEAARAGAQGKGFGVVAQEVKSLAEQSRQATNQVRSILGEIQRATADAVLATEESGKAVEAGARQTEVAGESIKALGDAITESAQAAAQISASSQQQLVGVDQVVSAMENIRQSSVQNVASASELETTARDLEQLGHRLRTMVERYKV